MFNTPAGIAVVDVATIGTAGLEPEIVGPAVRGGYFARRTREIYYGGAERCGDRRSTSTRNRPASVQLRARPDQRRRDAVGREERQGRRCRRQVPAPTRPADRSATATDVSRQADGRPHARSAVLRQERRRAGPSRPESVAAVVRLHKPQERRSARNRLPVRRPESPAVQSDRSEPSAVLPRRHVARAGPHVDHPHRRQPETADAHSARWTWRSTATNGGAGTARPSGSISRRRAARCSGSPASTWRPAGRSAITSSATGGACISTARATTRCSPATAATPSQVAYSTDGMWINLFRVQPGDRITREKLVDMSRHNYVTGRGGVEPNVHITPDKKWVVFTGQFAGGAPRLRGGNRGGKAGKIVAPPRYVV